MHAVERFADTLARGALAAGGNRASASSHDARTDTSACRSDSPPSIASAASASRSGRCRPRASAAASRQAGRRPASSPAAFSAPATPAGAGTAIVVDVAGTGRQRETESRAASS